MDNTPLVKRDAILELLRDVAAMTPASCDHSSAPGAGVGERAATLLLEIERQATQHCHYTCEGKGGRYELLGQARGAGCSRGQLRTIYRSTATGDLFFREPAEFASRMTPIEDDSTSVRPQVMSPIPVLARGFFLPQPDPHSYNFLDDSDDPGECDDSVPAVIIPRSEFDRIRLAAPQDTQSGRSE